MKLLRHGYIVTMDDEGSVYEDGFLAFDENEIISTGAEASLPEEYQGKGEDLEGALVFPGFVNLHTHMGMVPFRSLADDYKDRLRRFLIPLEDAEMTRELAVASSKLAITEFLLSGTTSALDMYFFESSVAEAAESLGFRLFAGEAFRDDPACDAPSIEAAREEFLRIRRSRLVTPVVAPHAPYSLSADSLHFCQELAREHNTIWTMHLEEMPFEMEGFKEKYGTSPVGFLDREGLLDESLLAAHMIFLSPEDIPLVRDRGVRIAHCPAANSKSGKGVAPIAECLKEGILVGMGTDGPSSSNSLDMFNQLRIVPYLQKNRLHDRSVLPAVDIVPLATRNGGLILSAPIGQLRRGFKADIQILSRKRPNMLPCYDPYSVLVYSADVQNIKDVYVDGVQKVKDGSLTDIDYEAVVDEFMCASSRFESGARRLL